MNEVKEKLIKLIDVKSIMTLLLTVAFVILVLTEKVQSEQFMVIYTTIVAFCYGTQYAKKG